MPACPPFMPGVQPRHEDSTAVFLSSGLNDAIESPTLVGIMSLQMSRWGGDYRRVIRSVNRLVSRSQRGDHTLKELGIKNLRLDFFPRELSDFPNQRSNLLLGIFDGLRVDRARLIRMLFGRHLRYRRF